MMHREQVCSRLFEMSQTNLPLAVAITGASGAVYAVRLLEVLLQSGREVHLAISPSGAAVIKQELDCTVHIERFDPKSFLSATAANQASKQLHYHHYTDYFAPLA